MNQDLALKELIYAELKAHEKALVLAREINELQIQTLQSKIETLQRLMYIGVGLLMGLQLIIQFIK